MKKNDLYRKDDNVLRVIHVQKSQIMVIDCVKRTMPVWMNPTDMCSYVEYFIFLLEKSGFEVKQGKHIAVNAHVR